MLWYNLRLHTRILLGYGLMLVLIAGLALFLALRSNALNAQIQQVNAEVTTEVTIGAQLEAQVATTQQAIDRYLQQPQRDNLATANQELARLTDTITSVQAEVANQQQRQRLDELAKQVGLYQNSFQALSTLLDTQTTLRNGFSQQLFDASTTLSAAITRYLTGDSPDALTLTSFVKAQENLQLASLWSARLVNEQRAASGQNAFDQLAVADFNLKARRDSLDAGVGDAVDAVFDNTASAATAISQYAENLAQLEQLRDTLLNDLGGQLKAQSSAIATAALDRLADATSDLESQSRQTQQLTGGALAFTLLLTALFGGWIPRTITRPLMSLVLATRQINQGDYAVAVSTRDRSELGELAEAFNQMAITLGQQHEEVLRQQLALTERNQDLEQTLTELQTTTAARQQLAASIRLLSVPVVPILDRVIMIPLVGEIDAERAETLLERLLEGITEERAQIAILDISGVPVVDIALVGWLIKASASARLLGSHCILVGISPEVAQALVSSGADLEDLETRADLRNAIEYALRTVSR